MARLVAVQVGPTSAEAAVDDSSFLQLFKLQKVKVSKILSTDCWLKLNEIMPINCYYF